MLYVDFLSVALLGVVQPLDAIKLLRKEVVLPSSSLNYL